MKIDIFIIIAVIIVLYKIFKKSEKFFERILMGLWFFVCLSPIIIYYLDRFNVPSYLGWVEDINSQDWLAFSSNYTSSISGAIIGGIITIVITLHQIKENNADNEKRDKENLRLQNMPILAFSLNNEEVTTKLENIISTRFDDATVYDLNIFVKNIGTNNIKNIKIDFNSEIINNKKLRLVGDNTLVVLEKEKEIIIQKSFFLEPSDTPYKIYITVYYQDVLGHWYKQKLEIDYTATKVFDDNGNLGKIEYKVEEEQLIDFFENINKGDI